MLFEHLFSNQLNSVDGCEPRECQNRIYRKTNILNDGVNLSVDLIFDGKHVYAHDLRDI